MHDEAYFLLFPEHRTPAKEKPEPEPKSDRISLTYTYCVKCSVRLFSDENTLCAFCRAQLEDDVDNDPLPF